MATAPSDSIRGEGKPPARGAGEASASAPRRFLGGVWRRIAPTGTTADTVGWLIAWFLVLAAGVQVAALVADNWRINQWWAYDTNAYWLAARHVASGEPLYAQALIYTAGAYKYPPVYAQMILPIGWLPEVVVDWAWRLTGVLCLRYLCGSWKLAVLAALQWPVFMELGFGNVTLQLGAVALWAFRDNRAAYLLPWFAGLKFGPALLIPYFWFARPQMRRQLVVGCVIFGVASLGSFAMAPNLWLDYVGTFGWEASSQMLATNVYAIVPNHGGLDFAIRFAIASIAMLAALKWRLNWLAFVAAVVTMPIFSVTRLAVLFGLWPLWLRDRVDSWRRKETPFREWLTAPLVHLDMLPERARGTASG